MAVIKGNGRTVDVFRRKPGDSQLVHMFLDTADSILLGQNQLKQGKFAGLLDFFHGQEPLRLDFWEVSHLLRRSQPGAILCRGCPGGRSTLQFHLGIHASSSFLIHQSVVAIVAILSSFLRSCRTIACDSRSSSWSDFICLSFSASLLEESSISAES